MYISIDMGGTNTRIAISTNLEDIKDIVKFRTNTKLVDQKNHINYQINKLVGNSILEGLCLGVPGTLDNHKFLRFPNYKELEGKDVKDLLGEYAIKNLVVSNDANIAGYCETILGAGKDYNSVLYITIGTGVGGVLIKDKNIKDVFTNFEPGHEVLYSDGLDMEDHVSGTAFKRIYNMPPSKKVPTNIWEKYGNELSKGLTYLHKKYSPDVIVLGGGVAVHNYKYFKKYLDKSLNIRLAQYGDNAGLMGGFLLLAN